MMNKTTYAMSDYIAVVYGIWCTICILRSSCHAAQMIPTRLRPNHQLWQLYLRQKDLTKAKKIGQQILTQPLKIENTYTLKAKAEIYDNINKD